MLGTILHFQQFVYALEKMCHTFLLPVITSWLILFFYVTSSLNQKVEAISGPSVDNWCSEKHCKNCAKSETLRCSENAFSSRCGDLCGCCQSCVQLRDLEESCGSQLAVRSSANKNFEDARSRVTIIATSSCKRGLVCIDFVCQGKNEAVDSSNTAEVEFRAPILNIENGFPEFRDLLADVVKLKNQTQFGYQNYNHNEVKYPSADKYKNSDKALTRKITRATFNAKPSLTKVLPKLTSHKNEVSNIQESMKPILSKNILSGSSRRFLNFIIDDREFQLIYGHDPLADLKILLNSVHKNQPNWILNEFDVQRIYDRLKNLLEYINKEKTKFATKKETNLYLQRLEGVKNKKNEDIKFFGNVLQSKEFSLLKNNKLAGISSSEIIRQVAEELRSKRQIEDTENSEVTLGIRYNDVNPKEQSDKRLKRVFRVYDAVNEPLQAMENVNKKFTQNVFYSIGFPLSQSFLFTRIPNSRRSGFRIEGFRKKRETKDAEESKVYDGVQYENSRERNLYKIMKPNKQIEERKEIEFSVNDFVNQHSDTMKNKDEEITGNLLHLMRLPLQQNFTFTQIPNYKSPLFSIGGFRKKRETKDAEELKHYIEPQYKNSKQQNFYEILNEQKINEKMNSEFADKDFVNKSSGTMKEVNKDITENMLQSMKFPLLQNFTFVRIPNTKSPLFRVGGFRKKRETKDAEELKHYIEPQYKNSKQQNFYEILNEQKINEKTNSEFVNKNFVNKSSGTMKTVNKDITENMLQSMKFPLWQNFTFVRIPNTKSPLFRVGGFRKKRETKDAEEPKVYIEPQYKNSEQPNFHDITNPNEEIYDKSNPKFPAPDFASETSQTIGTIDHHWLFDMEQDKLPTNQKMELTAIESAINIHPTELSKPGNRVENLDFEIKSRKQEKNRKDKSDENDYDHDDIWFKIFDTEANAEVPAMEAGEDLYNLENLVKVEGSKIYKNVEKNMFNNDTENLTNQDLEFNSNVYNFTFPKNLENDSLSKLVIRVNETVNEFRARLDRIETKVVEIASSISNQFFERHSNEKPEITGESEDSSISMNSQIRANPTSKKVNQSSEMPAISRQTKLTRFPKENLTGRSQHRRWKDFMILSNLSEFPTNLRVRGTRPNKIRGNGVDLSQLNLRRKMITRFPVGSEKKIPASITQIPSTKKLLEEDTPKFLTSPSISSAADYRHFDEYSSAFAQKNQHTSKAFADEESNYEMDSDPLVSKASISNWRILRPLYPAWNKVVRNKKTSTPETSALEESIFPLETQIPKPIRSRLSRVLGHQLGGRSMRLQGMKPVTTSTMMNLLNHEFNTQFRDKSDDLNSESWITKPSLNLFVVEDQDSDFESEESLDAAKSPAGFVLPAENVFRVTTKKNRDKSDDLDSESWITKPSLNLFVVEDQDSDFESEESLDAAKSPGGFVLPAENVFRVTTKKNRDVDDNWNPIYPEYLDYSEKAQKSEDQEAITEVGTTGIPEIRQKTKQIDLGHHERRKRDVKSSWEVENREELNDWYKRWLNDVSTNLDPNEASLNERNVYKSIFSPVFEKINEEPSENMISTSKLSRRRRKRSVQMVDWLRAAQEYHERLHQIRTAALKTWLASRDELEHSNLTDVKLFTREIPAYLDKYRPSYNENDESNEGSMENKMYSVATEDSEQSMTNDDESFGKIIPDMSSQFEDRSKKNVQRIPEQSPKISSSSMPRKFTIITTGNSTIRVEEMPKIIEDDSESSLEDQSVQSTTNSEVLNHEMDFLPSESEIFDHMYESIDAEDEDFDYGDSEFIISRLLDEVDLVDDSEEENFEGGFDPTSEDRFDDDEDNEDDDILQLFSRTKRDSPFFLFKAKGSPAHDVVIWPSNWQYLIKRHLKFNRLRSSATQPQKGTRRSYVKLSKIIPKYVATFETSAENLSDPRISTSKVDPRR